MNKDLIAKIIRRRLDLEDQEWSLIENNPKFQELFQNAIEASKYRLVAEELNQRAAFRAYHWSKVDICQLREPANQRKS